MSDSEDPDFSVYCAICGCSLEGGNIGSTTPSDVRLRRRIVALKRKARERGDPDPEDEEEDENGNGQRWRAYHSYDPELVSEDSLEWLYASCCLGVNPDAPVIPSKSFGYRNFWVGVEPGSDPNQPPEGTRLSCYGPHSHGLPVYPIHHCCLDVLTEVLTGGKDVAKIDKDVLFDAMSELTPEYSFDVDLGLDYGSLSGRDQSWLSVLGEEFSVTDPSLTPEVTELLELCLADHVFELRSGILGVTREPQVQDIFSRLPLEILLSIFSLLPGHTLLALLEASWPALCATRRNGFWKRFLRHDMPWLTKLWPLLDEQRQDQEPSYKAMYLWLNKVTTPKYGMGGPFMSLANRRRIWGVCEQLAAVYFRHLHVTPLVKPDSSILQGAVCRHMALISEKELPDSSWALHRTLFLYSEDEIRNKPVILEAYWGENGRLVGLGAVLGHQRRTFGLNGADMPHITRTTVRVRGNVQIKGVMLLVATADPNSGATTSPGVVAMEVHTEDGRQNMDPGWKGTPEVPYITSASLSVSDGTRLVGITGHIDQDGNIRSIGILEASAPLSGAVSAVLSPAPSQEVSPSIHHHFWAKRAAPSLGFTRCGTIGPSRVDHVFSLTVAPSRVSLVPYHLIPQEILVWGFDAFRAIGSDLLARLWRVYLYVSPGTDTGRPAVLHGLAVNCIKAYPSQQRPYRRYAGLRRNIGEHDGLRVPKWPGGQVISFKVDGPGGERIDEIAVSEGLNDALAFKIKTNMGREVSVGEEGSQGWTSQRAPEGESIIGLVVGFTGKTNVPGYGGLSSLRVMTKRV